MAEAIIPRESFETAPRIFDAKNAAPFASDLFRERFGQPFPVPRHNCGLSIPTPPENWRQYVARYSWDDGSRETVGFCNWIKYRDVYLEGGLCVKESFYRRMPKAHFEACRAAGGIAQMMMAKAAQELTDCVAWFGYCGDPKSLAVTLRAGYLKTEHPYIIVKWFQTLASSQRKALVDSIASIGPF